jgi:hypothetical protein
VGKSDSWVVRLFHSGVGGNRRVPQVRQSVPGPKKMGEAQRPLLLYWPQTSLSILKWIARLRIRLVKASAATKLWVPRTPVGDAAKSVRWAAPIIFVPRTLWRTWGTRRFLPMFAIKQTPSGSWFKLHYDSRAKTSLGARKNGGTIAGIFERGNTSSGSSIPSTSVINFRLF